MSDPRASVAPAARSTVRVIPSIQPTGCSSGDTAGWALIGLRGFARSPSLNGAGRLLERVADGMPHGDAEYAAMGVGGLPRENPARTHSRSD